MSNQSRGLGLLEQGRQPGFLATSLKDFACAGEQRSRGAEEQGSRGAGEAGEERVDRQLVLFPLLLFYLCCPQRKSSLTEGIGSGERRKRTVTTKISIGRQGNTNSQFAIRNLQLKNLEILAFEGLHLFHNFSELV